MTDAPGPVLTAAPLVVGVLGAGIVAADHPAVGADDLGLSRGDGCFETARVVTADDGSYRIDNLDDHLTRLARSGTALDLPVDVDDCAGLIHDVCGQWGRPGEAAVKLMVTRGVEGSGRPTVLAIVRAISAESLRQRREGVRAVTLTRGMSSNAYADARWLLGGVKSLSYALNMAAQREAVGRGADDAIWTSADGYVLESPTSAVVWSLGGRLCTTPDGPTGILASTTVGALFAAAAADGVQTGTALLPVADLHRTDGVWLVSSVRGVAQVHTLDGAPLSRDPERTDGLNACAGFSSAR